MSESGPAVMNPFWAGSFDFVSSCDTSVFVGTRYFDLRCRYREYINIVNIDTATDLNCQRLRRSRACEDHDRARDMLLRLNMWSPLQSKVPLCDRKPPYSHRH